MEHLLPGFVKRGLKAVTSRVINWLREWIKPDNHGLVGGAVADATFTLCGMLSLLIGPVIPPLRSYPLPNLKTTPNLSPEHVRDRM
jgi:hypothetical protein